jgi:hypothetical protein
MSGRHFGRGGHRGSVHGTGKRGSAHEMGMGRRKGKVKETGSVLKRSHYQEDQGNNKADLICRGDEGDEDFFDTSESEDCVKEYTKNKTDLLNEDLNTNVITIKNGNNRTREQESEVEEQGRDISNVPNEIEMANILDIGKTLESGGAIKKRKKDHTPTKAKKRIVDSDLDFNVLSPGINMNMGTNQINTVSNIKARVFNASTRSQGLIRTVIIKPIGNNSNSFLRDPVGLATGFKNSAFAKLDMETRINNRRNIVAVELKERNDDVITELLKTTKIGKWDVQCYQPGSDKIGCSGVIGPIDKFAEIEEIKEIMETENGYKITGISRLNKFSRGNKEPSTAIKVDFDGVKIPNKVWVGLLSFNVRVYVAPPLRCFRCQRIGHVADGCTAAQRCLVCAGDHSIRDGCTANIVKCANCRGPHKASSTECPFIQKYNEVKELSVREGIPISNAEKLVSDKHKNRNNVREVNSPMLRNSVQVIADVHRSQGSYIDQTNESYRIASYAAVTREKGIELPKYRKQATEPRNTMKGVNNYEADQSKQTITDNRTAENRTIDSLIESKVNSKLEEIYFKLGKMVNELSLLNLNNEGQRQRKLLVQSIIRNNLGGKIADQIIESESEEFGQIEEVRESCKPTNQPANQISNENSYTDSTNSQGRTNRKRSVERENNKR